MSVGGSLRKNWVTAWAEHLLNKGQRTDEDEATLNDLYKLIEHMDREEARLNPMKRPIDYTSGD